MGRTSTKMEHHWYLLKMKELPLHLTEVRNSILLLLFLTSISLSTCFNLEPRAATVFSDPTRGWSSAGRPSYFGFSVALLKRDDDNTVWLAVGAPRANSSIETYKPDIITEPGAFFKCSLDDPNAECQEVYVDPDGNAPKYGPRADFSYHDHKNNGWLGGAMDSQPSGRQATVVCAPRWKNQAHHDTYGINGECYWLNSSLISDTDHEMTPLIQQSKQYYGIDRDKYLYFYAHGQAGLSVHFPEDQTEVIMGAPGVFNWRGTVIRYKDPSGIPDGIVSRRRRQTFDMYEEARQFSNYFVPNPQRTHQAEDHGYLGYAVTSGTFKEGQISYVGGAPRAAYTLGKVFVFKFPHYEEDELILEWTWKGQQLGEYFGASVAALDINGDGLSDLVVGAPMHTLKNKPDVGRFYVFNNGNNGLSSESGVQYIGSGKANSRFATTLANVGDLNNDGFQDLAVGAPYEDDGVGAVYIYMGSRTGLSSRYSQKLEPRKFKYGDFRGFGMAISRGIDVDFNKYPDIAVGSFDSGHAAVFRTRPVASLNAVLISNPPRIKLEDTKFALKTCVNYAGKYTTATANVHVNLTLDHSFHTPRASFVDTGLNTNSYETSINPDQELCKEFSVIVKEDKLDANQALHIKMDFRLIEKDTQDFVQLIKEVVVDPSEASSEILQVGIVTGCEDDGDDTCSTDLNVQVSFPDMFDESFVVGSHSRLKLMVDVSNGGEPAFLPNLTVVVPEPLSLYLPVTHNCHLPLINDGRVLHCTLSNPISQGGKDLVEVNIDVERLSDQFSEVNITIDVGSEGNEVMSIDNLLSKNLQLIGEAQMKIHGFSKEEQLVYYLDDDDKINTTTPFKVLHAIQVSKKGPSPISHLELTIDIPVNISSSNKMENFLQVEDIKTEFKGQSFICKRQGIVLAKEYLKTFIPEVELPEIDLNIEDNLIDGNFSSESRSRRSLPSSDKQTNKQSDDKPEEELVLDCADDRFSCARLICFIGPWPQGAESAQVNIMMDLNLTTLAKYMPARKGGILVTQAKAAIKNSFLPLRGFSEVSGEVRTRLMPNFLLGAGIPWWIILLAVLAGIAFLALLVCVLYKFGFFERKQKDEMMAHQASIVGNDTSNNGCVGESLISK